MSEASTKAEATDQEFVTVEWRDLKFDVPIDRDDWPLDVVLALEEGKWTVALRGLVPRDQFQEFMATNPKSRDGSSLLDAIVGALGFVDAGESSASSA